MSEQTGVRWIGVVLLWVAGIGLTAWVIIGMVIPAVGAFFSWAGSGQGTATLIWAGIWVVCGIVAYFVGSLFIESGIGRFLFALLGVFAVGIVLIYFLFSIMFSGSERR